jgi:hypothetical protein
MDGKSKLVASQIFGIPSALASNAALTQICGSCPWYVSVGIWALVSIYVIAKL